MKYIELWFRFIIFCTHIVMQWPWYVLFIILYTVLTLIINIFYIYFIFWYLWWDWYIWYQLVKNMSCDKLYTKVTCFFNLENSLMHTTCITHIMIESFDSCDANLGNKRTTLEWILSCLLVEEIWPLLIRIVHPCLKHILKNAYFILLLDDRLQIPF